MVACFRSALLTTAICSRANIVRSTLQPFQAASTFILLKPARRGLANDTKQVSSDDETSEGPQSKEKTENAKRKIENDPRMKDADADSRMKDVEDLIRDKYAMIRDEEYQKPKNAIVLAHGLLGFEELKIAGPLLPGLRYWRGITEALASKGVEVYTAAVPASGSLEDRAAKLAEVIERKVGGKSVNIIAGLDSRYMISQLKPPNVKVLSLTTVATPHRGSTFADYFFDLVGPTQIPKIYKILEFCGLETGAFSQLTQKYMSESFNPRTPDREGVKYYSYGAQFTPSLWSAFRQSHNIVQRFEGDNDGLVSVTSAKWGTYKGTLDGCNHLDLINWHARIRWWIWEITGHKREFNAIAFYLDIADMLAKEGF